MNGYLVILSHLMDDFPLSLHATEEEAIEAARMVRWNDQEGHPFGRDASTPQCVSVLAFEDGKPTVWKVGRGFEEEE